MNYTIFIREKVEPKYFASGALNPGPQPVYPYGASLVYTPPTLDIYSDDPTARQVLLSDPLCPDEDAATMTAVDIAFPLFRDWRAYLVRKPVDKLLAGMVGHYLENEQKTWPYQREEAIRWAEGGMQNTPYCDAIALERGIPREELLGYVLQNARAFAYSANILGKQQAILDRIYAAHTVDAVMSEQWPDTP